MESRVLPIVDPSRRRNITVLTARKVQVVCSNNLSLRFSHQIIDHESTQSRPPSVTISPCILWHLGERFPSHRSTSSSSIRRSIQVMGKSDRSAS
jgi:hypothetical protein